MVSKQDRAEAKRDRKASKPGASNYSVANGAERRVSGLWEKTTGPMRRAYDRFRLRAAVGQALKDRSAAPAPSPQAALPRSRFSSWSSISMGMIIRDMAKDKNSRDMELRARALKGDDDAFLALWRPCESYIRHLLKRMWVRGLEYDDILQECTPVYEEFPGGNATVLMPA